MRELDAVNYAVLGYAVQYAGIMRFGLCGLGMRHRDEEEVDTKPTKFACQKNYLSLFQESTKPIRS